MNGRFDTEDGRHPARGTTRRRTAGLIACAYAAAFLTLPLLLLAPPASGAMLVAPLIPARPGQSLGWAIDNGALLIGEGPYAGSIVVSGSAGALWLPALANGALLIKAQPGSCAPTRKEVK